MGSVKPWQILLFIAALASLGFAAWSVIGGGDVKLKDQLYLLDVNSGELFVFKVKGNAGISIPAKHPDTGKRTLVNVRRGDDGSWQLARADVLEVVEADLAAIDASGNILTIKNESSPRRYVRPSL